MGMPKRHVVCVYSISGPYLYVSKDIKANGLEGLKAHEEEDVRVKEIESIEENL
jgi:hypothetical protein